MFVAVCPSCLNLFVGLCTKPFVRNCFLCRSFAFKELIKYFNLNQYFIFLLFTDVKWGCNHHVRVYSAITTGWMYIPLLITILSTCNMCNHAFLETSKNLLLAPSLIINIYCKKSDSRKPVDIPWKLWNSLPETEMKHYMHALLKKSAFQDTAEDFISRDAFQSWA